MTKCKVIDWWQKKFRGTADHLDSLDYSKPDFMSLSSPHPIWSSASSPFEVSKAVVSAQMLSGRYRTEKLMSKWSTANPSGFCQLPGCHEELGTLQQILLECQYLFNARVKSISNWTAFLVPRPWLFPIITKHTLDDPKVHLQFLLDPLVIPAVISASPEILRDYFYLARTWNFSIHLTREKIRKHLNIKS